MVVNAINFTILNLVDHKTSIICLPLELNICT